VQGWYQKIHRSNHHLRTQYLNWNYPHQLGPLHLLWQQQHQHLTCQPKHPHLQEEDFLLLIQVHWLALVQRLQRSWPRPQAALKSFAAQNGIVFPNWEFLSPAPAILNDLTKSFGFSYVPTPAGFDHVVQVTIVDGEGRIYRQVYGENLSANMLVEPLKQLITGAPIAQTNAVADIVDRVRILCSVYDPTTGKYRVNYALFFEIGGFLTFLIWVIIQFRRGRRAKTI
jgi:hypothetical protein